MVDQMLQGPAAQKLHEEEVKTLVSEAVEAKEAEYESQVTQLRQQHEREMQDCDADIQESNRFELVGPITPIST